MGFNAFSIADLLESQKKAFILLDPLLGLVGSIAHGRLARHRQHDGDVDPREDTRDRRHEGGRGGDAGRAEDLLVEASLIGLAGGLFGIALAGPWPCHQRRRQLPPDAGVPATNLFVIPWWLMAGAIGFALVVSLVAGSFPAMRAARLDPIQALRHD
jgi:putative ABC transport system permease protein